MKKWISFEIIYNWVNWKSSQETWIHQALIFLNEFRFIPSSFFYSANNNLGLMIFHRSPDTQKKHRSRAVYVGIFILDSVSFTSYLRFSVFFFFCRSFRLFSRVWDIWNEGDDFHTIDWYQARPEINQVCLSERRINWWSELVTISSNYSIQSERETVQLIIDPPASVWTESITCS